MGTVRPQPPPVLRADPSDNNPEAQGEAQNAAGKGQESWGKVKRTVSDAVEAVGDAIKK